MTVKRPRELTLALSSAFEVIQASFNGHALDLSRKQLNQPHRFEIRWRGQLAPLEVALDH